MKKELILELWLLEINRDKLQVPAIDPEAPIMGISEFRLATACVIDAKNPARR